MFDFFENTCVSILLLFDVVRKFVAFFVWRFTLSSFFSGLMLYSCLGNFHRSTARLSLSQVGIDGHTFEGSVECLTNLRMTDRMTHLGMNDHGSGTRPQPLMKPARSCRH